MQVITSVLGVVALRVSIDEVTPSGGLLIDDMLKYVGAVYNFAAKPQLPSGIIPAALQPFVFQSGVAQIGDERFPILHLVVLPTGDIVSSVTTEIADKIMDDYIRRLGSDLHYRYATAKTLTRSYVSNLVVEFQNELAGKVGSLVKVEELLGKELKRPFPLKRLAFGSGPNVAQGLPATLEMMEKADFILERREVEPLIPNRFFSAAPTTTSEHIRILESVERQLSG